MQSHVDLESEAFLVLCDEADRCEARGWARRLAERALGVTRGADFAVARDALDALLQRLNASRERELVVSTVAEGFRVTHGERAYDVWCDAEAASCSCPDFAKASLGICKHAFAVLERSRVRLAPRVLRWDPIRAMSGTDDWLSRLWCAGALPRSLTGLFRNRTRQIEPAAIAPERREATVEALLAACQRAPGLAEPAIVPLLERERAVLARRWPISDREIGELLQDMRKPLFPYQREGVTRFLRAGRLLLADDMGLGKTAQAIGACHALFKADMVQRAVVVTLATLKSQWEREWRAFSDLPLISVDGSPEARAAMYRRDHGVLLVHYQQLLRDDLRGFRPDLVILDEAQRIKNRETRTALAVKQLAPEWRLVLTGTPMENRLDELASITEWIDDHALEPRWRLRSWHSLRSDGRQELVGARNLETLRQRLAPHMLRRVRADVLAQLPPRRDLRVSVVMSPRQAGAHLALHRPIAELVNIARLRPLKPEEHLRLMALLNQQRIICNGLALRDFEQLWPTLSQQAPGEQLAALHSPKLLELRERLSDLAVTQQRKVVVFSQWRRMLQLASWAVSDVLGAAGLRGAFYSGQESRKRRTENLVAFHDDPATSVLFATDAGGVGLNLQRAASCCINLELPWNPAVLEQRIGRLFRLGQRQPVDVYNLTTDGGIEGRIAGLVGDKRALFRGLFDGDSDEVAFAEAGSFMTRIQALVMPANTNAPSEARTADAA